MPQYLNNSIKDVSITTMADIKKANTKNSLAKYDFSGLKVFLDSIVGVGLKEVNIEWEYKGQNFNSLCIVSDIKGIVYDNIITNLFVIKENSNKAVNTVKNSLTAYGRLGNSNTALSSQPQPNDVFYGYYPTRTLPYQMSFDAYWLWGSQRGHAEANYSVTATGRIYMWSGNTPYYVWNIVGSDLNATSYMTLGKCDAQIKQTSFVQGEHGQAYAQYGLYLASPTVSITMEFYYDVFQISIGSSIGSELHSTGAFFVTPDSFM